MHFLHTVILAIVEGLTEFLPVSSTGHLLIAERLLGFKDQADVFTVVIQFGAVLAASWFFRDDIVSTSRLFLKGNKKARQFYMNVLVGLIPAGLIGFALEASIGIPKSPIIIALALIIGGVVLWVVEDQYGKAHAGSTQEETIKYGSITRRQAIIVGLCQCLSLIPGVSRSGSTIAAGLVSGMNRATATAFSFYLSIPLLAAASLLKILKHRHDVQNLPGGMTQLVFGVFVTFLVAFVVVGWLLKYVSKHNLKPFAYYRVIFGVIVLILAMSGFFSTQVVLN